MAGNTPAQSFWSNVSFSFLQPKRPRMSLRATPGKPHGAPGSQPASQEIRGMGHPSFVTGRERSSVRSPGYAIRYQLFHAECLYRVDGCSALRRDNAGSKGAESKGEDRHGKDERVPSLHLIELVGDQARAANGDRNADGEPDGDVRESIVQNKADDIAAICTQSHAHTNFAGAALDGISGHSIEADGSENECKQTEE